jgi:hypothetical protein
MFSAALSYLALHRMRVARCTFGRPTKVYQLASRHLQPKKMNPVASVHHLLFCWSGYVELNHDCKSPRLTGCHTPPTQIVLSVPVVGKEPRAVTSFVVELGEPVIHVTWRLRVLGLQVILKLRLVRCWFQEPIEHGLEEVHIKKHL